MGWIFFFLSNDILLNEDYFMYMYNKHKGIYKIQIYKFSDGITIKQTYDEFVPSTMSTSNITRLCSKYPRNVCQPNSSTQTLIFFKLTPTEPQQIWKKKKAPKIVHYRADGPPSPR